MGWGGGVGWLWCDYKMAEVLESEGSKKTPVAALRWDAVTF